MTHLMEYMLKGGTNPLCDVWKGKGKGKKGKKESSSERYVERSKENKVVKNGKGNIL